MISRFRILNDAWSAGKFFLQTLEDHKKHGNDKYTKHNAGSFIGMAPADHPRYVVAISAEVPDGAGGEIAAPIFSQMMGLTLRTYRVPPS